MKRVLVSLGLVSKEAAGVTQGHGFEYPLPEKFEVELAVNRNVRFQCTRVCHFPARVSRGDDVVLESVGYHDLQASAVPIRETVFEHPILYEVAFKFLIRYVVRQSCVFRICCRKLQTKL